MSDCEGRLFQDGSTDRASAESGPGSQKTEGRSAERFGKAAEFRKEQLAFVPQPEERGGKSGRGGGKSPGAFRSVGENYKNIYGNRCPDGGNVVKSDKDFYLLRDL